MECVSAGAAENLSFVARRNNSLSAAGRSLAFGSMVAVTMGIAAVFALLCGAWPVLPFAGIEMAVLYVAFRHIGRHCADYERVTIEGDRVDVEVVDGGRSAFFGFNRYWTQVVCAGNGSRLALRSHGRELVIGRHMNREQRLGLALRLKSGLRGIG